MKLRLQILLLIGLLAPPAEAQSVLERVLNSYGGPVVTGLFVNAAFSGYHPLNGNPAYLAIDGSISNQIYGGNLPDLSFDVLALQALTTLSSVDIDRQDSLAIGGVNSGSVLFETMSDRLAGVSLGAGMAARGAWTQSTDVLVQDIRQLGGSSDQAVLAMNIASTAQRVLGEVRNDISGVSATVGNITATAIGAVNTGNILSGVSRTVADIAGL